MACFIALMLVHAGCMAYGLVSFWDRVGLDGSVTTTRDGNATVNSIDAKLYEATFWMNVKEFWDADAQPVACLIFFSGVIQPFIQLVSVTAIALVPLTFAQRHRMLSMQEVTCKIPLSSFFVEAYLLIIFTFSVNYHSARGSDESGGSSVAVLGNISVTGFTGLLLYFLGQLSFLPVINLLRVNHRTFEARAEMEGEVNIVGSNRGDVYQVERRLARRRPLWWRALVVTCSSTAMMCCFVSLRVPFITFTYSGAFEPFIHVPGSTIGATEDASPTKLSVNLYQICAKLLSDLAPKSHARFYCGAASMLLVINPCALALLAALCALVPDGAYRARRLLGESAEALQCWCGAENIAIASCFLSPNLELITSFVFDASNLCTVGGAVDTHTGQECLLVEGNLESGPTAALVAYAALTIFLARLCAWELHETFRCIRRQ